ncbi:hypothetical protein ACH427_31825 [Streptomyces sp. NPDC020379]|uniref:hypothetical protein n=1 Tax=Streptomyces sp. NPDC020379 TaxID=3365071 RepID=UPI003794B068
MGGVVRPAFVFVVFVVVWGVAYRVVEIVLVLRYRGMPAAGAQPDVRLMYPVDLRRASAHDDGDDPRHARPARVFPRADGRHRQYSRLTDERVGGCLSGLRQV